MPKVIIATAKFSAPWLKLIWIVLLFKIMKEWRHSNWICEISLNIIRLHVGMFSDEENTPKENVDSVEMTDNNNWLPIHYAYMNWVHAPIEVFQLLLKFYPRSTTHEVEEGGFPLEILEQYWETLSIDSGVEDDFNATFSLFVSFHPDIKTYRQDKKRLTRIKKAVIDELSLMISNDSELTVFCKSLWIWLRTFPNEEKTPPVCILILLLKYLKWCLIVKQLSS